MSTKTKYSGVTKLPSGKFQVQISLGNDPATGKRQRLKTTRNEDNSFFKSAAEAHKFITIQQGKFYKTGVYSSTQMTFDTLYEEYIIAYKITVKPQTFENKMSIFKIIKNHFGNLKLKDIKAKKISYFRSSIQQNEKYSKAYSSNIFSTLKRMLSFAVKLNYLTVNPALPFKALPKGKAKVEFWTKDEFEKVLSIMCIDEKHPYEHLIYVMIVLYFSTGIRVNEGTALSWSDVDFTNNTIHICKNIVPKGGRKNWKPTSELKTENANRIISVDDKTLKVLKNWKIVQEQLGLFNYILTYDGYPMEKCTINRNIKRLAKLAEVPQIQPKGLRHSHASYLIKKKIDILQISKRLGHSSPEITLKHYAHLYPNNDKELVKIIGNDLELNSAKESKSKFNGNQTIKFNNVP